MFVTQQTTNLQQNSTATDTFCCKCGNRIKDLCDFFKRLYMLQSSLLCTVCTRSHDLELIRLEEIKSTDDTTDNDFEGKINTLRERNLKCHNYSVPHEEGTSVNTVQAELTLRNEAEEEASDDDVNETPLLPLNSIMTCSKGIYECMICKRKCNTFTNLLVHQFNRHNPKYIKARQMSCRFYCKICDTSYKSQQKLISHFNYKHRRENLEKLTETEKQFQCRLCPEQYSLIEHRNQHEIQLHQNPSSQTYDCMVCKQAFATISNLRRHSSQVHKKTSRRYQCNECPKNFKVKYQFEHHADSHRVNVADNINRSSIVLSSNGEEESLHFQLNEVTDSFPCLLCSKTFTSTENLQAHGYYMHNPRRQPKRVERFTIATPYHCEPCNRNYKSKKDLDAHFSYKHKNPDASTEFKCRACSESFKKRSERSSHEHYVHKEQETNLWNCNICNRQMQSIMSLKEHITVTHLPMKSCYGVCETCGKSFASRRYLAAHVRTHINTRDHECVECHRRFALEMNLQRHMRRHGEKRYHCTVCPKQYTEKKDLRNHMFVHSGTEKSCICPVCSKGFYTENLLKVHFRRQHPVNRYESLGEEM